MKSEISSEVENEVNEYEDFQYEESTELAQYFIEDEIMPLLEKFDYDNPNEDYVPGVATFGLFSTLISELLVDGFTPDQLKDVIDEFTMINIDGHVH